MSLIIACKKATDPPDPGHWRGYYCRSCGVEVQVSPTGRLQLDAGGMTYCNACGFTLAERYAGRGKLAGVTANPAARRTIAETQQCDFCGLFTDHVWAWRTRGFGVNCRTWPKPIVSALGLWAACEECRPLVDGRDIVPLAARVSILTRQRPEPLEDLYRAMFACIFAGPIEWRRGDPRPAIEPEPDSPEKP